MVNIVPIIIVLVLFFFTLFIYTREKADHVSISVLAAIIACGVTLYYNPILESTDFLPYIEFKAIIFIISMQVIVRLADKQKIFQFIAVKAIHITKANPRRFFYLICFLASITAALMEDIMITMIYIPLVIRAAKILKMKAAPFIYGVLTCMNLGFILTPFPASNIIILNSFDIDILWFMTYSFPYYLVALVISIIILDFKLVRPQGSPNEQQKAILLEIMDPKLVVADKKKFRINAVILISIICTFFFTQESYLVALIGACFISLMNREKIAEGFSKVDWKILFFLIALFLLIGTMELNGIFSEISILLQNTNSSNLLIEAFFILIISALISTFLANTLAAVITIALIQTIIVTLPNGSSGANLLIIALLIGINVASFLPQGAPGIMMAITIASQQKVDNFTFKTELKMGIYFSLIHMAIAMGYLIILSMIS